MASYLRRQGENTVLLLFPLVTSFPDLLFPALSFRVETLADAIRKTLVYFGSLLKEELRLEYAQLLVKMTIINIYSIHHAAETHQGGCGVI